MLIFWGGIAASALAGKSAKNGQFGLFGCLAFQAIVFLLLAAHEIFKAES